MLDYRLYQLNHGGHIVGASAWRAASDDDAVAQAASHAADGEQELWNLGRLVRTFPRRPSERDGRR